MKPKLLTILLIIAVASAQNGNKDEDQLLQEIFGPPNAGSTSSSRPFTSANPEGSTVDQGNRGVAKPSGLDIPDQQGGQGGLGNSSGSASDEDKSCVTDENLMGDCVPYYLCDGNNTLINDGVGIIDIRVSSSACKSYLDICCTLPEKRPADNPIVPSPTPKEEEHVGCGWRNPDGIGFRITGDMDSEAKFGEFPWMVAILKIEPVRAEDPDGQKLNVYVGGGSLIHPSVVLTAAHYVANKKTYHVRAGEWDTQTKSEIYPYQDRAVQHVSVHKDFNSGNLFYDIAVLFLDKPMELAPNVAVACLPAPGQLPDAGTRCFASGWGKDLFGKEGRYQVILKRVEVPVVDRSSCQQQLRRTRLGRHFMLHSSFMCAGGEKGKDTCKGDGGSPLVCPIEGDKGRYVQSGIVSWGIGCGEDGTPGVYVNVANLRNWIDNEVAGRGYDPKIYNAEAVL